MAEEVAPGVWRLPQRSPVALLEADTNCYLLRSGSGVIVVDPPAPAPDALAALGALIGGWGATLTAIVVTHGHRDHTGGVAELHRLLGQRGWIAGHERVRAVLAGMPGMPPLDESRWRSLAEGDRVAEFEVLETPGHTADHICLWRAEDRLLIAGDTVAGSGTVVIAPPDGDMDQYLATLRRLRSLAPQTIGPGHGPIVRRPSELLEYYIDHRLQREARILAELTDEPQPVHLLVRRVYRDVSPSLYGLAEHSLLAHLIKLKRERRAAEHPEGWSRAGDRT